MLPLNITFDMTRAIARVDGLVIKYLGLEIRVKSTCILHDFIKYKTTMRH